jgi:hypothetical protein
VPRAWSAATTGVATRSDRVPDGASKTRWQNGWPDLDFTSRYKIDTSELFGYTATKNGKKVRGVGNTASEVSSDEDDPRFNLPSIYFLLGRESIRSMR